MWTDGSPDTGIATNGARGIKEHEPDPRGAQDLRGRVPLQLEHQERIGNRSDALRVEYRVKNLRRSAKESLVAGRMTLAELTNETDRCQASGVVGG